MSKLQDIADAFAKAGLTDLTITDHGTISPQNPEQREIRVMRANTTLGYLQQAGNGRWSFTAPEDAKFNDVAPIVKVLDDENVKLGLPEATE